jgi:PPOX class probable FMN-dependent enzyme
MLDDAITEAGQLREYVGEPIQRTLDKQLDRLDHHCMAFIARSPIAMLATSGADGRCDCSPRGGPPGFAHVVDERTLVLPDYKGNRRQDSHLNIVENPHAALLFMIPGLGETLRITGRARITRDEGLLAILRTKGDPPQLGLAVDVEEVFMHCAKAFIRSEVWDPSSWLPSEDLPRVTQIYRDHRNTPGLTEDQVRRELEESYRKHTW